MPDERGREELLAGIDRLVGELRQVCHQQPTRVVLLALEEMVARVLSETVHRPESMEEWLTAFTENVRGWWVADRGGPFRPQ